MRYSTHIDYLVASVLYLGIQDYWWARSPKEMARERSLDETKLQAVFEGFPGIFRRSTRLNADNGQHMYSLQARYAQKDGKTPPDKQISYIPPLDTEKIRMLLDFILKSADDERVGRRNRAGNLVAVLAAIVAAVAAIAAG